MRAATAAAARWPAPGRAPGRRRRPAAAAGAGSARRRPPPPPARRTVPPTARTGQPSPARSRPVTGECSNSVAPRSAAPRPAVRDPGRGQQLGVPREEGGEYGRGRASAPESDRRPDGRGCRRPRPPTARARSRPARARPVPPTASRCGAPPRGTPSSAARAIIASSDRSVAARRSRAPASPRRPASSRDRAECRSRRSRRCGRWPAGGRAPAVDHGHADPVLEQPQAQDAPVSPRRPRTRRRRCVPPVVRASRGVLLLPEEWTPGPGVSAPATGTGGGSKLRPSLDESRPCPDSRRTRPRGAADLLRQLSARRREGGHGVPEGLAGGAGHRPPRLRGERAALRSSPRSATGRRTLIWNSHVDVVPARREQFSPWQRGRPPVRPRRLRHEGRAGRDAGRPGRPVTGAAS